ncbi:MAG: GerW family sporulation protein, partial [Oscillospiraceae bacterium]|nr:GerW family sporulation protein [Oscillospiraceae bacterium]
SAGGNCFGGGTGAGINITPVSFLIIRGDNVKILPVDPVPSGPVSKAIDMVPEIMDKVSGMVEKKKEEKAAAESQQ